MLVFVSGTDSLNGWPRRLLFVLNLKKLGPIEFCLNIILNVMMRSAMRRLCLGLCRPRVESRSAYEMTAAGNSFSEVALNAF